MIDFIWLPFLHILAKKLQLLLELLKQITSSATEDLFFPKKDQQEQM